MTVAVLEQHLLLSAEPLLLSMSCAIVGHGMVVVIVKVLVEVLDGRK
jgi:hypothetical protein